MLSRRLGRLGLALAATVSVVALSGAGAVAGAAGADSPAPSVLGAGKSAAGNVGLTVSWLPTTSPVVATPGQTATSSFFVTNQSDTAVPVQILAATAVPGDDGQLSISSGADPRFPNITYNPSSFEAEPKTTTTVSVTVTVPRALAPGVYIVPAVVRPASSTNGNVRIINEIDALTTFTVNGTSEARVTPSFIGVTSESGGQRSLHLPGFGSVQIARTGHEVLRVLDSSDSSFLAYNEITATQTPFGHVVFAGHTKGYPSDLRNPLALYFPHRYRDFPISWQPSSLGIGRAHLQAFVGYHATPTEIRQVGTTAEVLVVDPWWMVAPVVYLGLLWLSARRKLHRLTIRRARAGAPVTGRWFTRPLPIIGSVLMALVVVIEAFLSNIVVFAAISVLAVVAGLVVARVAKDADETTTATRVGQFQAVTILVVLAALAAVVLGALSVFSTEYSMAVVAGAGVWVLVCWWLLWWHGSRPFVADGTTSTGPDESDEHQPPPPVAPELVAVQD